MKQHRRKKVKREIEALRNEIEKRGCFKKTISSGRNEEDANNAIEEGADDLLIVVNEARMACDNALNGENQDLKNVKKAQTMFCVRGFCIETNDKKSQITFCASHFFIQREFLEIAKNIGERCHCKWKRFCCGAKLNACEVIRRWKSGGCQCFGVNLETRILIVNA